MPSMKLSRKQRSEYTALRKELNAAVKALDTDEDYDAASTREQVAFDSLSDWVEENDLNYTEFDPRGTRADLYEISGGEQGRAE